MAKICQITGKKAMIGNNVSHSRRRTKREFAPNLKTKKFWGTKENAVRIQICTAIIAYCLVVIVPILTGH